ncbi:hypothetical protein [Bradyrhizobium sp.]|uniref:hypothetical protein n=1 Tax=Bradyrhizobium sp. TaxID=376 RepID=UPI0040375F02
MEETGFSTDDPGAVVHRRVVTFQMPDGEMVRAEECFFLIRMGSGRELSTERWTNLEHEVMEAHRWWSADELHCTAEQVWPEDLNEVLVRIGVWAAGAEA